MAESWPRFFVGFVASRMISMIGPESRSPAVDGTVIGTPLAGVFGGGCGGSVRGRLIVLVGCSFSGAGAGIGLLPSAAAHSLLQKPTTLPSRTPTAGARSASTGHPQLGQALMAMRE